jgi:flavodoxin
MKTVIFYKSILGSTKKYANWLADETEAEIYKESEYSQDKIKDADTVVLTSGISAANIPITKLLSKHWNDFSTKRVVVVAVGVSPIDDKVRSEVYEKLPKDTRENIKYFNLRGKLFGINKDGVNPKNLKEIIKELK